MKVYVIFENDYDAGHAIGVYSSRERAQAAVASMSNDQAGFRGVRERMDIAEFELDARPSEY